MSAPGKVSFGVFELNLASGELRKGGTRIRLQEQPFQVLKALVEKPGEVVSREELQQKLWPEDTFVDFEDGLSTAVKKIRRALGDSAVNPWFVETLPKRGYRFVAPVAGLEESVQLPRGSNRRPWIPWLLTSAAVASLAATLALFFAGDASTETLGREPVPLTSYPGTETSPTFSPDGGRVAFQWCQEGECDIYVRLIGSETRQQLTDHPGWDGHPAWSPDGKLIAFLRHHEDEWSLILMPAIGGSERVLKRGRKATFFSHDAWGPRLAWHPSGNWIAFASHKEFSRQIVAVAVETGDVLALTDPPPTSLGDSCLAFSPNGRELLFCRVLGWTHTEIYRMPVTGDVLGAGAPTSIPVAQRFMSNWVWMANGREIVGRPGNHSRLVRLELVEGAQPVPTGIGRESRAVAYNAATKRLVYSVRQLEINLWSLALDESGKAGTPEVVVASTFVDHQAELSPDGNRIAFHSDRSGNPEVWLSDADGTNPIQLTRLEGAGGVSNPTWSRDGERVVFGSSLDGGFDLYSIPATGGRVQQIFAHPGLETRGVYSTDGESLYFSSARQESARIECYVVPTGGGEQLQLTDGGGHNCRPSPDGRYLYYTSMSEQALWRKRFQGGDTEQLAGRLSSPGAYALWRDGLYYFAPSDSQTSQSLYSLNLATGKKEKLIDVESERVRSVSASFDGRLVVWSQHDTTGADLMLVEGFE